MLDIFFQDELLTTFHSFNSSSSLNEIVVSFASIFITDSLINLFCFLFFHLSSSSTGNLGLRAESRGLEVIQTQADELLPLKNKIDELKTRVKEVKRAITDILSNDEDMSMMYLSVSPMSDLGDISSSDLRGTPPIYMDPSKIPDPFVDTMNLEMLFENYLNEIEWIASEVEEVIDEITNTEENVVLQLDILRNRILRFELSLSMSSFVVTCGALITGLFGMNLTSHLETDKNVFYIVTAAMVTGMAATWVKFARYGRQTFGKAE